jgi:hypothetical protein
MKKEKNVENVENVGITTQSKFTQADIPALLETVNSKIKELSKNNSTVPVITTGLPGFGPISQINDVMRLLQACSSIDGKLEAYNNAANKYLPEGIKKPTFLIEGHSPAAWLEVITIKISEISHKKELDKLKSVKATLEANLSQEMKLANDLAKISELLNED